MSTLEVAALSLLNEYQNTVIEPVSSWDVGLYTRVRVTPIFVGLALLDEGLMSHHGRWQVPYGFAYPVDGSLVGLVWERTFIVVTTTLASGIKDVDSVFVSNNERNMHGMLLPSVKLVAICLLFVSIGSNSAKLAKWDQKHGNWTGVVVGRLDRILE